MALTHLWSVYLSCQTPLHKQACPECKSTIDCKRRSDCVHGAVVPYHDGGGGDGGGDEVCEYAHSVCIKHAVRQAVSQARGMQVL